MSSASEKPYEPGRELDEIYARRFAATFECRASLWKTLVDGFFQRFVRKDARVLDLGCGYAQFINAVQADKKYAMDLNPRAGGLVNSEVSFFLHDCSTPWPLLDHSLDVIFTSNFLEHLPDKTALRRTMGEAARCLAPGGKIICLGPNIRYLSGAYWDFWDHHIPMSDRTICELLELTGFTIDRCIPRFLPYTMSEGKPPPLALVQTYLRMPLVWGILGRQFLVIAHV